MRESTSNRIDLEDVDPASFKEVLKFIYCGNLPVDINSAAEAYLPIADKYGVLELKEMSARVLEQGITAENVIERVILAHLLQCPSLKKRCLHFLKEQPALDAQALQPLKAHPDLLIDYMSYKPN